MNVTEFLSILKAGANLHQSELLCANDYRPDRTTIEYILTCALMRAAIKRDMPAHVETLCRKLVNVLTSSKAAQLRSHFGKKRFDVVLGDLLMPNAIIEVKIGVRTINKLTEDVDKILSVITVLDYMKKPTMGALVFEIHIVGNSKIVEERDYELAFRIIFNDIENELMTYIKGKSENTGIIFDILSQSIMPAQIFDGTIDADGTATFICAALIISLNFNRHQNHRHRFINIHKFSS